MKNWRTTVAGIAALIGVVGTQAANLMDDDPTTTLSWAAIWTAILAVGLFAAKDGDK